MVESVSFQVGQGKEIQACNATSMAKLYWIYAQRGKQDRESVLVQTTTIGASIFLQNQGTNLNVSKN